MTQDNGSRRWWALGALSLSMLAVGLDGTVLSVALPELSRSLSATETDLQWFTSSYLLFLAAAMLPIGLLGDRYGRKPMLMGTLALFALASAGCAYADSPWQFITARCVLGVAGAGIIVMALSAVTTLFGKEERPKAVGIWSAANFLALPLGPLLGGWMLTHFWYGWVFLLNVPITLVSVVVVFALVPATAPAARRRLDLLGAALSTLGLVAVTYGLIRAGEFGWGDVTAWSMMVGGVVVTVAFGRVEVWLGGREDRRPMLEPDLFRSAAFTWGIILIGIVAMANIGVLFTMPQYFQAVRGTDAMGSGLRLLPLIGGLVFGAVPADKIAKLVGTKVAVAAGFAVLTAGLLLGAATTVGSGDGFVGIWMAVTGFGVGLAMATATSAALSQVSEERSGVAAAAMQAVNKVGAPFGAAVLGSVLANGYQHHLALHGLPSPVAHATRSGVFGGVAVATKLKSPQLLDSVQGSFVHGMDLALAVSGGISLVGLACALVFMPAGEANTEAVPADTVPATN